MSVGLIKALQGPRTGATKRFQDFLDSRAGSTPITNLKLCRRPLAAALTRIANAVSLGSWERVKHTLGYDNVFHNFLMVKLANGQVYRVEKNHVVEHAILPPTAFHDESIDSVDIALPGKPLTVREMVARASASDPLKYRQYDARNQNCQRFTYDMIVANGMTASASFLQPQDAEALVTSLGLLKGLPKRVTDLASVADRLVYGDGLFLSRSRRIQVRNGHVKFLFPVV